MGVPILVQAKFKVCAGVHSGPKGLVIDINISICGGVPRLLGNMFKRLTDWRPQCLSVQTKFEVCVGVRSGPKGPVIDLSIFGLESRWGTFWAEGPVIDISICGVQSIWEPLQIVKGWGGVQPCDGHLQAI